MARGYYESFQGHTQMSFRRSTSDIDAERTYDNRGLNSRLDIDAERKHPNRSLDRTLQRHDCSSRRWNKTLRTLQLICAAQHEP